MTEEHTLTLEHGQVEAHVVRFRDLNGREQVLLTHEAWRALGYPEGITVKAVFEEVPVHDIGTETFRESLTASPEPPDAP